MSKSRGMTPKHERFVAEYLIDLNGKQAAIRTGYSPKTAEVQASRLLRVAKVKAAVEAGKQARAVRAGITAERVLEEMRRLAFSDLRTLFDEDGNLRPVHTLTAEQAAAISSLEVIIKNAAAGDGHTDTIHKLRVWDKPKTLEMLGKHLGLFEESARVSGTIELVWGSGS